MLEYLNQYFENRTGIISFNGKSFDVPLLQTRFIQNRTHSSLDMQQHFDLLHAARRIWKDDFGDCRLGTLESRVLGFRRVGDIPGEQIPQIYMDYLRFGEYQPLKPVIEHNRLDIVSLLALVIKISELIHDSDKLAFQQKQRVAQLFSATKKHQDASNIYRQARNEKAPSPYAQAEYLWEYGQSLKRAKDFVAAEKVWLEMVDLPHRSVEAMIELAKHFEHRLKDFKQALAFTERAIHKIQIRTELAIRTAKDEMLLAELNHRKTRVEEKLNKL